MQPFSHKTMWHTFRSTHIVRLHLTEPYVTVYNHVHALINPLLPFKSSLFIVTTWTKAAVQNIKNEFICHNGQKEHNRKMITHPCTCYVT